MASADATAPTIVSLADAFNMAARAFTLGDLDTATHVCDGILAHQPDHAETRHLLGLVRLNQGDPAAALALIKAAWAISGKVTMLTNIGVALTSLARPVEAWRVQRVVVALEPGNAIWLRNLAIAARTLGRAQEASRAFRAAAIADPTNADALDAMSRALFAQGRPGPAAAAAKAAVIADPRMVEPMTALGVCLSHLNAPEAGYRWHRRALILDPTRLEDAVHLVDHDRAGQRFDRLEDTRARLAHALTVEVSRGGAERADWRLLASVLYRDLYRPLPNGLRPRAQERLDTALRALVASQPPLAPMAPNQTAPAPMAPNQTPPVPAAPKPAQRLRVGYLSAHLKNHPIGQVTLSALAAHDRGRIETLGLLRGVIGAAGDPATDPYAARHRQGFERVEDLSALSPVQATARIRELGVDIVVYLDGHMDKDGLEIMARRPAPARIYWLGHAGGIGAVCADHLIADRIVIPPGEEGLYGERVIRLPHCYHCADRHPIAPTPPTRQSQGLPDDAFVFCAFNNVEKIDLSAFTVWMGLLRTVDRSVLWLSGSGRAADNLRRQAAALGVDPARIVFASRIADKSVHLARYRLADLFLDTWTMNASTTALDALWAGVPMVALRGDRFTNRISNSMLAALGMGDLVCPTVDTYTQLTLALVADPARLAGLRDRIAAALTSTPLFDAPRLARALEAAYERVWRDVQAGRPPMSFDLVEAGS